MWEVEASDGSMRAPSWSNRCLAPCRLQKAGSRWCGTGGQTFRTHGFISGWLKVCRQNHIPHECKKSNSTVFVLVPLIFGHCGVHCTACDSMYIATYCIGSQNKRASLRKHKDRQSLLWSDFYVDTRRQKVKFRADLSDISFKLLYVRLGTVAPPLCDSLPCTQLEQLYDTI